MNLQVVVSIVYLLVLVSVLVSVIKGAPFVVSNRKTIDTIISLVKFKKFQRSVDLGSGDGRLIVALSEVSSKVYGYEISPLLVIVSYIRILLRGLNSRVFVHFGSFWGRDLKSYDLVVVFGVSYLMGDFEKKFDEDLKKGTYVITNAYKLPNWKVLKSKNGVYLYRK